MGAKESAEMKRARKLVILGGMTAYAAAKRSGITRNAIYVSKWYKDWKKKKS